MALNEKMLRIIIFPHTFLLKKCQACDSPISIKIEQTALDRVGTL